jgi:hypothetical protein
VEFLHADGLSDFNERSVGMPRLFMTLTSFVLRKGGMKESEELGKNVSFSLSVLLYFFQEYRLT